MRDDGGNGARTLLLAAAITSLGSCYPGDKGYDMRAVAIGGKLAFVSSDRDYDCVANIHVATSGDARATPAAGDAQLMVVNGGVFWWTDNDVADCPMRYPIFYGAGGSKVRTLVTPKKLDLGVIYDLGAQGEGATGVGCFQITEQRRIENLPYSLCARPRSDQRQTNQQP